MRKIKKYFVKSKSHSSKKSSIPKIKAGADAKLKKVFASIGAPDKTEFKPDTFQLDALLSIEKADCLVTAPTGSGKTWIAEQAIAKTLNNENHAGKGKSWYASPLKALTNSKYHEFAEIFGAENVGILTGDRKENPNAPIIVGTTEILRNQLYDAMHIGKTLSTDLVILDEAHFLGDEDRGVVWEEIMIYLPSRIPLLLLSATIGNARYIAKWLSSIRSKECIVVNETKRPVPLFPIFFHPSGTLFPLIKQDGEGKKGIYKKVSKYLNSEHPPLLAPAYQLPPFAEIINVLRKYNLLPAIFFMKSRADCNKALELCEEQTPLRQKEERSQTIKKLVAQNSHIANHYQLEYLEKLAVGAHHSGQLPAWKLVIESLMTKGLLDAVFATSTVAAGVNFPARTIVLLNSDRFNGKEFLPLNPTEFHQMTGRAGRRGIDNIGFMMALPGKFMDVRLCAKLVSSPPSNVVSQIKINFSMTLNLLLSHTPHQIEDILKRSFATYSIAGKRRKKTNLNNDHKYLWQDFLHHFDFLTLTGYADKNGKLTDDGIWASQLRVDHPLIIAEGFRLQLFPDSDPAMLAAIISAFVNERETDEGVDRKSAHKKLLSTFLTIKKGLRPFVKNMMDQGFGVNLLYISPCLTIYAWANGYSWEKTLELSGMAEGDLAMLIFRTADNLKHIRSLAKVFPKAAATASTAIELIMKEPVVMEL